MQPPNLFISQQQMQKRLTQVDNHLQKTKTHVDKATELYKDETRMRKIVQEQVHPIFNIAQENMVTNAYKNEELKNMREDLVDIVKSVENLKEELKTIPSIQAQVAEIKGEMESRLLSFELKFPPLNDRHQSMLYDLSKLRSSFHALEDEQKNYLQRVSNVEQIALQKFTDLRSEFHRQIQDVYPHIENLEPKIAEAEKVAHEAAQKTLTYQETFAAYDKRLLEIQKLQYKTTVSLASLKEEEMEEVKKVALGCKAQVDTYDRKIADMNKRVKDYDQTIRDNHALLEKNFQLMPLYSMLQISDFMQEFLCSTDQARLVEFENQKLTTLEKINAMDVDFKIYQANLQKILKIMIEERKGVVRMDDIVNVIFQKKANRASRLLLNGISSSLAQKQQEETPLENKLKGLVTSLNVKKVKIQKAIDFERRLMSFKLKYKKRMQEKEEEKREKEEEELRQRQVSELDLEKFPLLKFGTRLLTKNMFGTSQGSQRSRFPMKKKQSESSLSQTESKSEMKTSSRKESKKSQKSSKISVTSQEVVKIGGDSSIRPQLALAAQKQPSKTRVQSSKGQKQEPRIIREEIVSHGLDSNETDQPPQHISLDSNIQVALAPDKLSIQSTSQDLILSPPNKERPLTEIENKEGRPRGLSSQIKEAVEEEGQGNGSTPKQKKEKDESMAFINDQHKQFLDCMDMVFEKIIRVEVNQQKLLNMHKDNRMRLRNIEEQGIIEGGEAVARQESSFSREDSKLLMSNDMTNSQEELTSAIEESSIENTESADAVDSTLVKELFQKEIQDRQERTKQRDQLIDKLHVLLEKSEKELSSVRCGLPQSQLDSALWKENRMKMSAEEEVNTHLAFKSAAAGGGLPLQGSGLPNVLQKVVYVRPRSKVEGHLVRFMRKKRTWRQIQNEYIRKKFWDTVRGELEKAKDFGTTEGITESFRFSDEDSKSKTQGNDANELRIVDSGKDESSNHFPSKSNDSSFKQLDKEIFTESNRDDASPLPTTALPVRQLPNPPPEAIPEEKSAPSSSQTLERFRSKNLLAQLNSQQQKDSTKADRNSLKLPKEPPSRKVSATKTIRQLNLERLITITKDLSRGKSLLMNKKEKQSPSHLPQQAPQLQHGHSQVPAAAPGISFESAAHLKKLLFAQLLQKRQIHPLIQAEMMGDDDSLKMGSKASTKTILKARGGVKKGEDSILERKKSSIPAKQESRNSSLKRQKGESHTTRTCHEMLSSHRQSLFLKLQSALKTLTAAQEAFATQLESLDFLAVLELYSKPKSDFDQTIQKISAMQVEFEQLSGQFLQLLQMEEILPELQANLVEAARPTGPQVTEQMIEDMFKNKKLIKSEIEMQMSKERVVIKEIKDMLSQQIVKTDLLHQASQINAELTIMLKEHALQDNEKRLQLASSVEEKARKGGKKGEILGRLITREFQYVPPNDKISNRSPAAHGRSTAHRMTVDEEEIVSINTGGDRSSPVLGNVGGHHEKSPNRLGLPTLAKNKSHLTQIVESIAAESSSLQRAASFMPDSANQSPTLQKRKSLGPKAEGKGTFYLQDFVYRGKAMEKGEYNSCFDQISKLLEDAFVSIATKFRSKDNHEESEILIPDNQFTDESYPAGDIRAQFFMKIQENKKKAASTLYSDEVYARLPRRIFEDIFSGKPINFKTTSPEFIQRSSFNFDPAQLEVSVIKAPELNKFKSEINLFQEFTEDKQKSRYTKSSKKTVPLRNATSKARCMSSQPGNRILKCFNPHDDSDSFRMVKNSTLDLKSKRIIHDDIERENNITESLISKTLRDSGLDQMGIIHQVNSHSLDKLVEKKVPRSAKPKKMMSYASWRAVPIKEDSTRTSNLLTQSIKGGGIGPWNDFSKEISEEPSMRNMADTSASILKRPTTSTRNISAYKTTNQFSSTTGLSKKGIHVAGSLLSLSRNIPMATKKSTRMTVSKLNSFAVQTPSKTLRK